MTDLEKLVEARAHKEDPSSDDLAIACREGFRAGATDPMIRKAIELRARIKTLIEVSCALRSYVYADLWNFTHEVNKAEAELAQLMAGIEEKA